MPNCDWYGIDEDHLAILDFLFGNGECEIYESYSKIGQTLRNFQTTSEVLAEFDHTIVSKKKWNALDLKLRVIDCSPAFEMRKVNLDSKANSKPSHRFSASGWGLVSLSLCCDADGLLRSSHTNHNTENRATTWAGIEDSANGVKDWDFRGIQKFSSKLNRFIRKQGIAKISSRVVLPKAFDCWKAGVEFDNVYSKVKNPDVIKVL